MNKRAKLLDFKLKRNLWSDIFWAYKSLFHGTWIEFVEHREYLPGDMIKTIDWKVSARTWKLQVKKYEEERNIKILFIIDLNETYLQFKDKKEILEEVFYTLALSWLNNNDNISIVLNVKWKNNKSIVLPYSYEIWNIFRTIDILENYNKNQETLNFEEVIKQVVSNQQINNNLVFVLTDNDKLEDSKDWRLLWLKNEVIYINIYDYFENNLVKENTNINLTNGGKFMDISLLNKDKIEKYQKLRQLKLEQLKQELLKNNIWYLYLDNSLDVYKWLYKFFLSYDK